jgi:hypothetical protein
VKQVIRHGLGVEFGIRVRGTLSQEKHLCDQEVFFERFDRSKTGDLEGAEHEVQPQSVIYLGADEDARDGSSL